MIGMPARVVCDRQRSRRLLYWGLLYWWLRLLLYWWLQVPQFLLFAQHVTEYEIAVAMLRLRVILYWLLL